MLDYLKDIVKHTYGLGFIDLIKVTGTANETVIDSISADRAVIIKAKINVPVAEFIGQFGMPNLGKLNILLNIPEYSEDAQISVTKKKNAAGVETLTGIHFQNKAGDFQNDYRFMVEQQVNASLRTVTFNGVKWDVDFVPAVQNIQRMKFMTSANSEETTFIAKTDGNKLKFYFGDHSTHSGEFVFADGITGKLTHSYLWPVAEVNSILSLPGDKAFKFSNEGAAQITVNSGIATYDYIIPAQQK